MLSTCPDCCILQSGIVVKAAPEGPLSLLLAGEDIISQFAIAEVQI